MRSEGSGLEKAIAGRLDTARTVALEAGALAFDYFRRRTELAVETKAGGQDVVSLADHAVETFIRDAILQRFPEDGLIGEEHGETRGRSPFRWVIDPIDGTSPFLHGLPAWTVSIAVAVGNEPVAGAIAHPCANSLYWAEKGGGAFRDEERITIQKGTPLTEGLVALGVNHRADPDRFGRLVAELLRNGGAFVRNGSAALSLAHVAAGHYLAYHEPSLNAWDALAGILLVREAGGIAASFPIGPPGPCFACAPQVEIDLRRLIEAFPQVPGSHNRPVAPVCAATVGPQAQKGNS